jgi:hypothetical protein
LKAVQIIRVFQGPPGLNSLESGGEWALQPHEQQMGIQQLRMIACKASEHAANDVS